MTNLASSTGTAGNHNDGVELTVEATLVAKTPIELALLLAINGVPVRPDVPTRPGSGPSTELPEIASRFQRWPEAGVVAVVNGVELKVPVGQVPTRAELEAQAREEWNGRNRSSRSRRRFPIIHGVDIERREPPVWLVANVLVERSIGRMVGQPGAFKSFLAMGLAASVATGTPWHGHRISKPGKVLYVLAEDAADTGLRVEAWRLEHGFEVVEDLDWLPEPVNLWRGEDVATLIAQVADEGYVLIVFDTQARSMAGGEENSSTDMGLVMEACDRIKRELNTTVLLIHHTGKDGKDGRGSSAALGAVDTEMMVRRAKGGAVMVTCEKLKMGAPFAPMILNHTTSGSSVILVDTDDDDDDATGNSIEVLSALGDDWATVAEIMEATGLANRTVGKHLNKLLEAGMAERDPKDDKRGVVYRWRRSRG